MKPTFTFLSTILLTTFSASALVACGSSSSTDGDGAGGETSTGGATSTGSELVTKLSKCPELSTSSDPEASTCLFGKYEGKTLAGDSCSLEIAADGAYKFESPKLTHDRAPMDDTIFVYDYTKVQETNLLAWHVSDPISTDAFYELKFDARFGSQIVEKDRKIEIEVSEFGGTSATCIVEL